MTYVECLAMYFLTNEIGEAARKRAVLLSVCGPTAYRLIRKSSATQQITRAQLRQYCQASQRSLLSFPINFSTMLPF